jgi:hypothetical protein
MNYPVRENQNLYDVYFQHFGDESGFSDFLSDNSLQIDSELSSRDVLAINNDGVGNEIIKRDIIKNNLLLANKFITLLGEAIQTQDGFFILTKDGRKIISK